MNSNSLPRVGSRPAGSTNFYEQLRGEGQDDSDIEHRAGVDEDNWAQNFRDQDLEQAEHLGIEDSRTTVGSRARLLQGRENGAWPTQDDEVDNDVPASLLVEHHPPVRGVAKNAAAGPKRSGAAPLPGRSDQPTRRTQAQWARAQAQQPLHDVPTHRRPRTTVGSNLVTGSAKERAMWRWINVANLDAFMKEVYEYYLGSGFWCIICERVLHLA